MREGEHRLIIDQPNGHPGGVSRIRDLIDSSIDRFETKALRSSLPLKSEAIIFNGLADRGKSVIVEETIESINSDPRIQNLREMGMYIPVQDIKIEHAMARVKPSQEELDKRILPYMSGFYTEEDYAKGSKELTLMFHEAFMIPGFYIGEMIASIGYKFAYDSESHGWDIGSSTTCDLARKQSPFEDNYEASFIAVDAEERIISWGRAIRGLKEIQKKDPEDVQEEDVQAFIKDTGVYTKGQTGGASPLSVANIEDMFKITVAFAQTQGKIPRSSDLKVATKDFYNWYYRELLSVDENRFCNFKNLWLGDEPNEGEYEELDRVA